MSAKVTRRRLIAICAATAGSALVGAPGRLAAAPLVRWRGVALGAEASITLSHDDPATARRLIAGCRAEIERLESMFSLYRADSALVRLNRAGELADPPPDMLELLSVASSVNAATFGAFDPTVQPLWRAYARLAAGDGTRRDLEAARHLVGWDKVAYSPRRVRFGEAGMALTLNGIAQGYATDKVANLLRDAGLDKVLVSLGEQRALGTHPSGRAWRVAIADPAGGTSPANVALRDKAIATSAANGTSFDAEGTQGHILDPRTMQPLAGRRQVSVIAPRAVVADGLSTGFCLLEENQIRSALTAMTGVSALISDGGAPRRV